MLFNSIDFAIFLPIVFVLYWFISNKSLKLQNILIVVASYVFYAWWDWRFLSLIVFSTVVDYFVGLKLKNEQSLNKRKILLWISILVNIGFLGFFKYFNFFLDNFVSAFSFFGAEINAYSLKIALPVGISFYTFQTLSYTIDVYRRKFKPTEDFIAFAAFVSFFPQLVAGPIERASNLLPQFFTKRIFNYANAVEGLKQVLWGLFKKLVIADNCAVIADQIFNNSADFSGSTLFLGAVFFAFQIYGDFSGYSDIAIGVSRLFGFSLKQNFAFPYFSRDMAEFWRRWHISLSTWFRDYLYIPLGGSKVRTLLKVRNVFIVFIVSGFWHGAKWNFIIWGILNAVYFLPLLLTKTNRKHIEVVAKDKLLPNLRDLVLMIGTFVLTVFAWIFFRTETLNHAIQYISDLFRTPESYLHFSVYWNYKTMAVLLIILFAIEWFGRENKYALENIKLPKIYRWGLYLFLGLLIFVYGNFNKSEFIYFAF